MTSSFLFAGKCAARGRTPASAQQKARRGNPARASGAISVNTRFWKILVTRVKRFLRERLKCRKQLHFSATPPPRARTSMRAAHRPSRRNSLRSPAKYRPLGRIETFESSSALPKGYSRIGLAVPCSSVGDWLEAGPS